jgi:hypothetical protein
MTAGRQPAGGQEPSDPIDDLMMRLGLIMYRGSVPHEKYTDAAFLLAEVRECAAQARKALGLMPSLRQAVAAERERCAKIAEQGCLVPPDGGSPTEDERLMCEFIAACIRGGSDELLP